MVGRRERSGLFLWVVPESLASTNYISKLCVLVPLLSRGKPKSVICLDILLLPRTKGVRTVKFSYLKDPKKGAGG